MQCIFYLIPIAVYTNIIKADRCTSLERSCYDYRTKICPAGYDRGMCDGSSNVRCCKPCSSRCTSIENYFHKYRDSKCKRADGKCMDESNYCANSNWHSGMCGGSASRKCCLPSAGRKTCTLVTYKKTNLVGYRGKTIRVEPGFVSSMDLMNAYAKELGVTIYVTSSFRKANVPVSGAIVEPASRSNHMVGHAIDMNLDTPIGWCNSKCLAGEHNAYAKRFTNKIKNSKTLTWGQIWRRPDPVHIDDRLNVKNTRKWDNLYRELQQNCR